MAGVPMGSKKRGGEGKRRPGKGRPGKAGGGRGQEAGKAEVGCERYRPPREYSHTQELIDNLPYMTMTALGAAILLVGIGPVLWGWLAALGFVLYGIAGTLWFIIFICPYCHFYGTRLCPCGYGQFAVRFRKKAPIEQFKEKFNRNIPVIFPMWFIPVIAGVYSLWTDYTLLMLVLLIAFCVDSFVVLPLVSRMYGCAHCEQKDDCPWMR
jgi:hypothetical protein